VLYQVPQWVAELVTQLETEPWYSSTPRLSFAIAAVPHADVEERLLIAMLENMTLSQAASAARLLSRTG
jgi:hypothetical protein